MDNKPPYQYIFDMLDYADLVYEWITPGTAERSNYFLTLVYIEDIMDTYGRDVVLYGARDNDIPDEEARNMMNEATRRMDSLRTKIRQLAETGEFDERLAEKSRDMLESWRKRSDN